MRSAVKNDLNEGNAPWAMPLDFGRIILTSPRYSLGGVPAADNRHTA